MRPGSSWYSRSIARAVSAGVAACPRLGARPASASSMARASARHIARSYWSTELLPAETGTKIDLGAMPAESVARCRAAWARLIGRQTCVVHANPNNPGNVRVTANRVALIDWGESHVDVPDLDLGLPHNAAGLDDSAHDIAAHASAAWAAAVCGDAEYAVNRLAEVRTV